MNRYEEIIESLSDEILTLKFKGRWMIVGDFNCPGIINAYDTDRYGNIVITSNYVLDRCTMILVGLSSTLDLEQSNFIENNNNILLDLCYSNFNAPVELAVDQLVKPDNHHPPLHMTINRKMDLHNKSSYCNNNGKSANGMTRIIKDIILDFNFNKINNELFALNVAKVIYTPLNICLSVEQWSLQSWG